jgi:hypothetical protein
MKETYKEYHDPFVIEATKLTSIVQAVHAGLANGREIADHFDVLFSGSQRKTSGTVEEVLALDNSTRERIHGLVFSSKS